MGLPLFVAPVESDLPSKSASKHGVTSPPRSSIRRSGWRDTRVANVRRGGLRLYGTHGGVLALPDGPIDPTDRPAQPRRSAVRVYGPGHREIPSGMSSDPSSWTDAHLPPSFVPIDANEPIPSPFREALASASQDSDRRRGRLQELLHASLRSTGRMQHEEERTPEYLGWFSVEPDGPAPAPPRRVQLPRASHPHFVHTSDGPRSSSEAATQPMTAQETLAEMNVEQSRLPPAARAAMRIQARVLRNHMARRSQPPRRGVDGLGDRDRSLSPEVWDTLLTTLTPDPQPPSASSSFASAAASQTAAPSSTTTPSSGNANPAAEPPCDSGCENSEGEDGDYNPDERARGPRRRRINDEVGDYNPGGPSEGPFVRIVRRTERGGSAPRPVGPDGPSRSSRHGSRERTAGQTGGAAPLSRLLHPAPQDGWVGRLLVGASDEEQGDETTRRDREGSDGQNASGADEDLSGMQRIIRSLSWRQDIPEEWWAEAGLRRTLPPDTEFT